MSHQLLRLTTSLYNTPHLATPATLEACLAFLDSRNQGTPGVSEKLWSSLDTSTRHPDSGELVYASGIGVIPVEGALTYKPVGGLCGDVGTSYESLVDDTENMAKAGVKTLVFEYGTGGGEATHVFEAARKIRSIADENGMQLIGYADTMAASAGYALMSVCDVRIANPSASVGSIGCVVALLDTSKYESNLGVKRIYVTSSEGKVPFADDGTFKESFLADISSTVNTLGDEFCEFVSEFTGLSFDEVKATDAKCFTAKKAMEVGLVDLVMTRDEFHTFVSYAHKN